MSSVIALVAGDHGKGDTGDQGQGLKGDTGDQGGPPQGLKGDTGDQGGGIGSSDDLMITVCWRRHRLTSTRNFYTFDNVGWHTRPVKLSVNGTPI